MLDTIWFFMTVAVFSVLGIYAKGKPDSWQLTAQVSFTFGSCIGFLVRMSSGLVASVATQAAVAVAVIIFLTVSDRFAVRARKTP